MAYEWEQSEWRMAVRDLSDTEREVNQDSHRAPLGLIGDAEDDQ